MGLFSTSRCSQRTAALQTLRHHLQNTEVGALQISYPDVTLGSSSTFCIAFPYIHTHSSTLFNIHLMSDVSNMKTTIRIPR